MAGRGVGVGGVGRAGLGALGEREHEHRAEPAGEEGQHPHPGGPAADVTQVVAEQPRPVGRVPLLGDGEPQEDLAFLTGPARREIAVDPGFGLLVGEPPPPLAQGGRRWRIRHAGDCRARHRNAEWRHDPGAAARPRARGGRHVRPGLPRRPAERPARGRLPPAHRLRRGPRADRRAHRADPAVLRAAARRAARAGQPAVPALPRLHAAGPRDHRGPPGRARAARLRPRAAAAAPRGLGRALRPPARAQPVARSPARAGGRDDGVGGAARPGRHGAHPRARHRPRRARGPLRRRLRGRARTGSASSSATSGRRPTARRPKASARTPTGASSPCCSRTTPAACRPGRPARPSGSTCPRSTARS